MSWLTLRVKYVSDKNGKHQRIVLLPSSILSTMLYSDVIDLVRLKINEEAGGSNKVYSIRVV